MVACFLAHGCGCAIGQPAADLKFEVAPVRLSGPLPPNVTSWVPYRGGPGTSDPRRVTYTRVTMKQILLPAFGLQEDQVKGPDWVFLNDPASKETYTIAATLPAGTIQEQLNVMMQNLLKERFRLACHMEKKQFDKYQLIVAKSGPKLKNAAPADGPPPQPNAPGVPGVTIEKDGFIKLPAGHPGIQGIEKDGVGRVTARMSTTAELIPMLKKPVGSRHIEDKTGLTGKYDFKLEYAVAPNSHDAGQTADHPIETAADPVPSIFTALEQQLGLKLVKAKTLLDLLVIDHMDRVPTAN